MESWSDPFSVGARTTNRILIQASNFTRFTVFARLLLFFLPSASIWSDL